MITVSAPGKVHIIGEHAIVYGHPAIIAAVGKRIYVDAEKSSKVALRDARWNSTKEWSVQECRESADFARTLWETCREKGNFSQLVEWAKDSGYYRTYWKALIGTALRMVNADGGISIHITRCDIPTGSGLGSSSAAAVAIAKAASEVYGRNFDLDKINEIAFECEKLAHGNPSGGDNSACCYGGLVWFQKSTPKNVIISLRDEISHKLENFLFVYTKEPEKSTGELVQMVKSIPEEERNTGMEELARMTHEMKIVLKHKNYSRMKEIMNRTNEILSSFNLSIPETDKIHSSVASIGGGAKMCGACGGGVMLAWHEDLDMLKREIRKLGFETFEADLGVEGVRVEN